MDDKTKAQAFDGIRTQVLQDVQTKCQAMAADLFSKNPFFFLPGEKLTVTVTIDNVNPVAQSSVPLPKDA